MAVNLTGGIDADVAWSRGFTPLRQKVPSGQAILFTSDDGLSGPWDAVPSARVRMYGDDQRTLCIAVITPNRNVAARVLRKFGNDSAACGIEEKLEIPEDVRETLGARLPSPDIAICGIPSEVVNDFSAFRTGKKTFFGNVDSFDPRQSRKPGFHYIELPYVLDEITYRLTMTFFPNRMIWAIVNGKADVEFPECDLQGATLISKKIVKTNPDGGIDVEFVVAGHRRFAPFFFGIEAVGEIDGFFRLSQAVLRWDLGPTDNNSLETVNCGNGPE